MRRAAVMAGVGLALAACGGDGGGPELVGGSARWIGGEPIETFDATLQDVDPDIEGVEIVVDFTSDEVPERDAVPPGVLVDLSIDGQDTAGIELSEGGTGGFRLEERDGGFSLVYNLGELVTASDLTETRDVLIDSGLDPEEVDARVVTDGGGDGELDYDVTVFGELRTSAGDVEFSHTVSFLVVESEAGSFTDEPEGDTAVAATEVAETAVDTGCVAWGDVGGRLAVAFPDGQGMDLPLRRGWEVVGSTVEECAAVTVELIEPTETGTFTLTATAADLDTRVAEQVEAAEQVEPLVEEPTELTIGGVSGVVITTENRSVHVLDLAGATITVAADSPAQTVAQALVVDLLDDASFTT